MKELFNKKQLIILYSIIIFVINLWLILLLYSVVVIKSDLFYPLFPLFICVVIVLFFIEFYFVYNHIFEKTDKNENTKFKLSWKRI